MGDFKKSKKLDSSKSGESTDLDSIIQDIGDAEQEADEQIQTLETRISEIKGLEEKLESVSEKLSQVEGEALQIAQKEINQEIQQKESEAAECRNKLQEITEEMQEKQAEISEEIGNREEALSELQTAEKECDVELSDAKEAVNGEKETLEDTNSKIEELLGKIGSALADNQAEKKTDDMRNVVKDKERFNNVMDFVKKAQTVMVLASSILTGLVANKTAQALEFGLNRVDDISDVIEIRNRMTDSIPSLEKDMSNLESTYEDNQGDKLERRKKEIEVSSTVRNQPNISNK